MSRHPYPSATALLDDCVACAADQVIADVGGPAWDAEGFARLVSAGRDGLAPGTARVLDAGAQILAEAHEVEIRLSNAAHPVPALVPALADMRSQFAGLVYSGFVAKTGARRLPDVVRYLPAMVRRLDNLAVVRDPERKTVARPVRAAPESALLGRPPAVRPGPDR